MHEARTRGCVLCAPHSIAFGSSTHTFAFCGVVKDPQRLLLAFLVCSLDAFFFFAGPIYTFFLFHCCTQVHSFVFVLIFVDDSIHTNCVLSASFSFSFLFIFVC